jgi:shikimate dehydrogenase
MYPHVGISPIPKNLLREDLLVYDIVYKPVKTKLIEYAEMAGANVIHGYEMLVSQAAGSFSLWTGSKAPMGVMRRTALQILGV